MTPRTIYVVGKGRSGSTLVGDFLGSLPGVFHTGELNKMWEYSIIGNHSCACGEALHRCPVWSQVIRIAKLDKRCAWCFDDPSEMARLQRRWGSFSGGLLAVLSKDSPNRYLQALEGIATAIQAVTHCHTIVDSSKWPLDPRFFDKSYSDRVDILHVVRNPWAVSRSWATPKKMPHVDYSLPTYGKVFSAFSWSTRIFLSEAIRRWRSPRGLLLKFEDVTQDPEAALKKLAGTLELQGAASLLQGDQIRLAPGHTVLGNPSRFVHGDTAITELKSPIPKSIITTVLTWPARRLIGY